MKILNMDELQIVEGVLQKLMPKSLTVYGSLRLNRNKPNTMEVLVDTWPDFKVIICRPHPKNKHALEFRKHVIYYSKDEQILRRMLTKENTIDWSTYFLMAGCDISHAPMLKEVSSVRGINVQSICVSHVMYLPDSSHLPPLAIDSELESRMSSLNDSHSELVNKTWKFGGDERGNRIIKKFLSNFPSCCITDGQGQPVSWIVVYDECSIGVLYTLPEHRGKGYAKVLVSTMAKNLHAQGYPVYCFIEEENIVSYRLFKNLGFTEDPSYRAACSGISIRSLDDPHIGLMNQTWGFGQEEDDHKPPFLKRKTACGLDSDQHILCHGHTVHSEGKAMPKSWSGPWPRNSMLSYPVYSFIEDNMGSYRLFTEDPSYRAAWIVFNSS